MGAAPTLASHAVVDRGPADRRFTVFATPKPFVGHIGVIQRNAIRSWAKLGAACDIILLGSDEGIAEMAGEIGAVHLPHVETSEYGTPLISSIFAEATKAARTPRLAYVNADVILTESFAAALTALALDSFLLVGRRWELALTKPIDFELPNWENDLRRAVAERGYLFGPHGMDFFAFARGQWGDLPPFRVGRHKWDNWLMWFARSRGFPVIDATGSVMAVHQSHDRSFAAIGRDAAGSQRRNPQLAGPEAFVNYDLAGDWRRFSCIWDADYRLGEDHDLARRSRAWRGTLRLAYLGLSLANGLWRRLRWRLDAWRHLRR